MVLQIILAAVAGLANMAYWYLGITRWQNKFRARCERRYGVTIALANKGFWSVEAPNKSWIRRLGIEMMQLVYIMGLFFVWAVLLLATIFVSGGFAKP